MVLLDQKGHLIRPSIIWCDQRSITQVEYINNKLSTKRIGEITCNAVATGFQIASLLWIKQNEPDNYKATKYVILPKDYIRYKLTGMIGTDFTDASSTLAFDNVNCRWSDEIINGLELRDDIFPNVFSSWEIAGFINTEAAVETGLNKGTPVVYGGADQPMQALGSGTIKTGIMSSTIGTGGQLLTPIDEPIFDNQLRTHTFCNVDPKTWYIMGASLNAGLALNWFCKKILNDKNYNDIDSIVEEIEPCSNGLVFLPYLTGDRTPHLDPYARGVFFGITLQHDYSNFLRSVMEGVVFSMRDSMGLFKSMGIKIHKIIATGGGAKSKVWLQMQADIYQHEIYKTKSCEQAAIGAAIMAGLGAGLYTDVTSACEKVVKIGEDPVFPDPKRIDIYNHYYQVYKELYEKNKYLFKAL